MNFPCTQRGTCSVRILRPILSVVLFVVLQLAVYAQEDKSSFLEHCYFGLSTCYIDYPFSNLEITPTAKAQTITIPHTGFRINFLGYQFNETISAELSLLRPVYWVAYNNVTLDHSNHTVWVTEGSATLRGHFPVYDRLAFDVEGGLGVVSRHGFQVNHVQVLNDANFASILVGAALNYRISTNFDLLASVNYTPRSESSNQPATSALALGFHYHIDTALTRHAAEIAQEKKAAPDAMIQVGYTPPKMSYATNRFFTEGKVPLFFKGDVQVSGGYTAAYQRTILRTPGIFSLDAGVDVSAWTSSRSGTHFVGVSIYPVCKFALYRCELFQLYFNYSVAGPSLLTKSSIDGTVIGEHFIFQDYMGLGCYIGPDKKFYTEVRIGHYSNGNIFPQNPGIDMPLTFIAGYTL